MQKIDVVQGKTEYAVYVNGDLRTAAYGKGNGGNAVSENLLISGADSGGKVDDFTYRTHEIYPSDAPFPKYFKQVMTLEMVQE